MTLANACGWSRVFAHLLASSVVGRAEVDGVAVSCVVASELTGVASSASTVVAYTKIGWDVGKGDEEEGKLGVNDKVTKMRLLPEGGAGELEREGPAANELDTSCK